MAIRTDRSDLPAGDRRDGIVPDRDSPFVRLVTEGMHALMLEERGYGDDDVRPMAREGADFRHSDGGGCARQFGYKAQQVEFSDPPTIVDRINMHTGTVLGAMIQRAVAIAHPGAQAEVVCGFDEPVRTAGHIDIEYRTEDDRLVVVEDKTVGGYAYKLAIGERSEAKGPAWGAVVQGSLNATARDADELVIFDFSKELISKGIAERKGIPDVQRGLAAWHYTPEQFRPVAQHELKRVRKVLDLVAEGQPVPAQISDPEIPTAARIVDPSTGRWQVASKEGAVVDSGTWWGCGYCWFRSHCAAAMAAERAAAA